MSSDFNFDIRKNIRFSLASVTLKTATFIVSVRHEIVIFQRVRTLSDGKANISSDSFYCNESKQDRKINSHVGLFRTFNPIELHDLMPFSYSEGEVAGVPIF